MEDYERQKLSTFLERNGKDDLTPQDVEPALQEKMEFIEERMVEDLDHEEKVDWGVSMLESEDIRESRTRADGEEMELNILSIGHRGIWEDHPATDEDTLTAHGIIHGPIADDGSEKAAKAVFLIRESDTDLLDAATKFSELNELQGTFKVEEAWDLKGFYRIHSTEGTDPVEVDLDDLPSGRDEKNTMLRKMFNDVDLAALAEDGDGLSSYDPESGFTHDWGADIKRFRGTIVDYFINDNRSFGVYTVRDSSVTPDDIDESSSLMGENQNVPGLTVYAQPDWHMGYGNESVVDIYGVMEVTDDGQIVMRAAGVVPIIPTEMDDGDDSGTEVEATEDTL